MNPFNLPLREATSLDVIYETIGEDGITRLVRAFYRQVPSDDVLAPMYPKDDLEGSEERLRDFLLYRFGGPQRYIENAATRDCACGTRRSRSTSAPATGGYSSWTMPWALPRRRPGSMPCSRNSSATSPRS